MTSSFGDNSFTINGDRTTLYFYKDNIMEVGEGTEVLSATYKYEIAGNKLYLTELGQTRPKAQFTITKLTGSQVAFRAEHNNTWSECAFQKKPNGIQDYYNKK